MNAGAGEHKANPPSRACAWLQLVRVPNLLTVPGDPIAGYLLASGAHAVFSIDLLLVCVASLTMYAWGLIVNDLADLPTDRRERPLRPLPAGLIRVQQAQALAMFLSLAGMGLVAWIGGVTLYIGGTLLATILAYNLLLKRVPLLGPLAMGSCRSLSLCLGASVVGSSTVPLLVASAILTAYVSIVTLLARNEARARRPGPGAWVPAVIILAGMCALLAVGPTDQHQQVRMGGALFLSFALASFAAIHMRRGGPVPEGIGLLIGALIPLQSAFCMESGVTIPSMLLGFALLALWPVHRLLSRWFYGS